MSDAIYKFAPTSPFPRPQRLGSGFRVKSKQRSQIAKPLSVTTSRELACGHQIPSRKEMDAKVFGEPKVHSRTQKLNQTSKSFNQTKPKSQSHQKEKICVTQEEVMKFYSNIMQCASSSCSPDKDKILAKSFDFRTDFQNFKNAQTQVQQTLENLQEQRLREADLTFDQLSLSQSTKQFIRKEPSALQVLMIQNMQNILSKTTLQKGSESKFNSAIKSQLLSKTMTKEQRIQDRNLNENSAQKLYFCFDHHTDSKEAVQIQDMSSENNQANSQFPQGSTDRVLHIIDGIISPIQNQIIRAQSPDQTIPIPAEQELLLFAQTKQRMRKSFVRNRKSYREQNGINLLPVQKESLVKRKSLEQENQINRDLQDHHYDVKPKMNKIESANQLEVKHRNRPTSSYLNKHHSNFAISKVDPNTKSNEVLHKNKVISVPSKNDTEFDNLRKSLSDHKLIEQQNTHKQSKLNIKSLNSLDADQSQSCNLLQGDTSQSRFQFLTSKNSIKQSTRNYKQIADLKQSEIQSLKSIYDRNYRKTQQKVIEREVMEHFKYSGADKTYTSKPLLASRAIETLNLRQQSLEHKIEQFFEQTNQYNKLKEFRNAKNTTAAMFDFVSGNSRSLTEQSIITGTERHQTRKKSEMSTYAERQKHQLKGQREVQRKHELLLQQQVMLCLQPQQHSTQSLQRAPTLINLPDQQEIQEQLEALVELSNLNSRRYSLARPPQTRQIENPTKSPLDNAISAKSIRLAAKPKDNVFLEETFNHDRTLASANVADGFYQPKLRVQSAYVKSQMQKSFVNHNRKQVVNLALQTQGQISPRILSETSPAKNKHNVQLVATKETDVRLVKVGAQIDGSAIMKYSAWNNQQRGMPLKVQFQVLPPQRRIKSAAIMKPQANIVAIQDLKNTQQFNSIKLHVVQEINQHLKDNQGTQLKEFQVENNAESVSNGRTSLVQMREVPNQIRGNESTTNTDENKFCSTFVVTTQRINSQVPASNVPESELCDKQSSMHRMSEQIKVDQVIIDDILKEEEILTRNELLKFQNEEVDLTIAQEGNQFKEDVALQRQNSLRQLPQKRRLIFSRQKTLNQDIQTEEEPVEVTQISKGAALDCTKQQMKQSKARPQTVPIKETRPPQKAIQIISEQFNLINQSADNDQFELKSASQKPPLRNYMKTFGQRVEELIHNFDRKFILRATEAPEAIQTDLQATKCNIGVQLKKTQKIRPLTGVVLTKNYIMDSLDTLQIDGEESKIDACYQLQSGLSSTKIKSHQSALRLQAVQNRPAKLKHSEPELKKLEKERSCDLNSDLEHVVNSEPNLIIKFKSTSNQGTSENQSKVGLVQLLANKEYQPVKSTKFRQKDFLKSQKTNSVQPKKSLDFLQTTELLKKTASGLESGRKIRTQNGLVVDNLHTVEQIQSLSCQQTMVKNINAIKFQDFNKNPDYSQQVQLIKEKKYSNQNSQGFPESDLTRTQATLYDNQIVYDQIQKSNTDVLSCHKQLQLSSKHRMSCSTNEFKQAKASKLPKSRQQFLDELQFKGNHSLIQSNSGTKNRLTFGSTNIQDFFKSLAKHSKAQISSQFSSAMIQGHGMRNEGTTNSHVREQRAMSAKDRGVCSKARPVSSNLRITQTNKQNPTVLVVNQAKPI